MQKSFLRPNLTLYEKKAFEVSLHFPEVRSSEVASLSNGTLRQERFLVTLRGEGPNYVLNYREPGNLLTDINLSTPESPDYLRDLTSLLTPPTSQPAGGSFPAPRSSKQRDTFCRQCGEPLNPKNAFCTACAGRVAVTLTDYT